MTEESKYKIGQGSWVSISLVVTVVGVAFLGGYRLGIVEERLENHASQDKHHGAVSKEVLDFRFHEIDKDLKFIIKDVEEIKLTVQKMQNE